jgi:hypothetical protein
LDWPSASTVASQQRMLVWAEVCSSGGSMEIQHRTKSTVEGRPKANEEPLNLQIHLVACWLPSSQFTKELT